MATTTSDRKQRAARAEQMRKEREKADRKQRNLITVAIVVVVVALIAVGAWAVSTGGGDDDIGVVIKPAHTNASYGFDYTAADAGGTVGADPVRVVLYEDFQCPVCKVFEEQNGAHLDDLVKKGEITIEYRMFAFLDSQSSTDYSTRSAGAAMAVLDKGGAAAFKTFHDLLFANQPPEGGDGLDDETLIELARQAGVTGIDADVENQKYAPWVRKALKAGDADGIEGTPTIVINGETVAPTADDIDAAIAAAR